MCVFNKIWGNFFLAKKNHVMTATADVTFGAGSANAWRALGGTKVPLGPKRGSQCVGVLEI